MLCIQNTIPLYLYPDDSQATHALETPEFSLVARPQAECARLPCTLWQYCSSQCLKKSLYIQLPAQPQQGEGQTYIGMIRGQSASVEVECFLEHSYSVLEPPQRLERASEIVHG